MRVLPPGSNWKDWGVSENRGTPKSSHFNRVFHYKPSILGYPYFWKHPLRQFVSPALKLNSSHQKRKSLEELRGKNLLLVSGEGTLKTAYKSFSL